MVIIDIQKKSYANSIIRTTSFEDRLQLPWTLKLYS